MENVAAYGRIRLHILYLLWLAGLMQSSVHHFGARAQDMSMEPVPPDLSTSAPGATVPDIDEEEGEDDDDDNGGPGYEYHYVENTFDNSAGLLIRPEAAAILKADTQEWLLTKPVAGDLYLHNYSGRVYRIARGWYIPDEAIDHWKVFYINYLFNTPEWRQSYMDNLVRIERLSDDYKRVPLRGQRGVFANTAIPRYTIIGTYAGIILRQGSMSSGSFDRRAELEWLQRTDPDVADDDIRRYAFSLFLTKHQNDSSQTLIVSGLRRSNAVAMINSYWAPPETESDNQAEFNVGFDFIRMDDLVPMVILYARRDIQANEELMTNYGAGYWRTTIPRDEFRLSVPEEISLLTSRFWQDAQNPTGAWRLVVPAHDLLTIAGELTLLGLMDETCLEYPILEVPHDALQKTRKCSGDIRTVFFLDFQWQRSACCCPRGAV